MNGIITNTKTRDLLLDHKTVAATDCAAQVVETVLLAGRGELKEFPLIGAAIRQHLGGNTDRFWPQETKKMIRACGVAVNTVDYDAQSGEINIR